jgi:hypothetical protein
MLNQYYRCHQLPCTLFSFNQINHTTNFSPYLPLLSNHLLPNVALLKYTLRVIFFFFFLVTVWNSVPVVIITLYIILYYNYFDQNELLERWYYNCTTWKGEKSHTIKLWLSGVASKTPRWYGRSRLYTTRYGLIFYDPALPHSDNADWAIFLHPINFKQIPTEKELRPASLYG